MLYIKDMLYPWKRSTCNPVIVNKCNYIINIIIFVIIYIYILYVIIFVL